MVRIIHDPEPEGAGRRGAALSYIRYSLTVRMSVSGPNGLVM